MLLLSAPSLSDISDTRQQIVLVRPEVADRWPTAGPHFAYPQRRVPSASTRLLHAAHTPHDLDVHVADVALNLIWARNRHTNALCNALREYFPAALETLPDLADRDTVAVLAKAPGPSAASKLSVAQIRSALRAGGRQRNLDRCAAEIQAGLRREHLIAPAPVERAFTATTTAAVKIIIELNRQIGELETELSAHFEQHPDAGDGAR